MASFSNKKEHLFFNVEVYHTHTISDNKNKIKAKTINYYRKHQMSIDLLDLNQLQK